MSEHPLIFSTDMVRAILEDRKTQTRRVPVERYRNWKVGDLIWVRETHVIENTRGYEGYVHIEIPTDRPIQTIENDEDGIYHLIPHYRATEPEPHIVYEDAEDDRTRWLSSMFMSKWAARIWLRITGLKEEYLHSISLGECTAEGIEFQGGRENRYDRFIMLWDSINAQRHNGIYASDKNPKVKVIEFERVRHD